MLHLQAMLYFPYFKVNYINLYNNINIYIYLQDLINVFHYFLVLSPVLKSDFLFN